MGELTGMAAVVTGSTRGIGLAVAHALAEEGAGVVLNGRNGDALDDAIKAIPGSVGVAGNAGDTEVAEALVSAAMEHFGRIDIAVANAATPGRLTPVIDVSDEQWERSLRANLTGPFALIRAAGREMIRQNDGGSIVVVGSLAGERGLASGVTYSAAKAGLVGLVAASAKDLGPHGVRVNLVQPSALTRMSEGGWGVEGLARMSVLGRAADPAEVAEVVTFLAGRRSSYVTGETINVDGGVRLNFGAEPGSRPPR